ncbi:MAG: excalibur calcium-binding domain-containing protein [Nanoarchaeota archaeon]|nr:excalibur calcium-binding domain-containing protein [Nanoarchaeota archaeon]
MPSHNPYEYVPADRPRIINWPKIILWTLGILILAFIIVFFIMDPLSLISDKANDLLNNSQGIAVGEPNPNGYDCSSDVYNCGNFTTQSEAQVAFDSCFDSAGDVWGLDNDGDGRVCEGLS